GALFERGAFGKEATAASAAALRAFATGLPAYLLAKTIAPAFYAREDTATPFRYAIIAMAANTSRSLALFPLLGFVGVALAPYPAAWLDLALLSSRLVRDRIFVPDLGLKRRATGMVAASIAMGAALAIGNSLMAPALAETGMAKVGALVLLVAGGMLL